MKSLIKIIYDVVVGLQYGDEGKGKISQMLALIPGFYQISARFNGGPNAGHTMYHEGKKIVLHVVPAGVLANLRVNFIGPGCVVDPVLLKKEVEEIQAFGFNSKTIFLSELVHLITPFEKRIDIMMNKAIGTTGRGIGPTYAHKAHRIGLRVHDVFRLSSNGATYHSDEESVEQLLWSYRIELSPLYTQEWLNVPEEDLKEWAEAVSWLNENIRIAKANFFLSDGEVRTIFSGESLVRILAEGAQAVMLDLTFGTYPFVTSSNCLASSAPAGLGLPGNVMLGRVIGVFKAYVTRVGNGSFSTEMKDSSFGNAGPKIIEVGQERGSTTGRPRRVGWLDLTDLQIACELNGVTDLYMTKVDILSPEVVNEVHVSVRRDTGGHPVYKKFTPFNTVGLRSDTGIDGSLSEFISTIESSIGIPINTISVGPNANDLVRTKPTPEGVGYR